MFGGSDNLRVGGVLVGGTYELVIIMLDGNTVSVHHVTFDDVSFVLYLVSAQVALVLTGVMLKRILSWRQ